MFVLLAVCLVAASCGRQRRKQTRQKSVPDGIVWVQLRGPNFSFRNKDAEEWNIREAVIRYRLEEIRKRVGNPVSTMSVSMYELVDSKEPLGAPWKPTQGIPPPPPPPEPPPVRSIEPPADFWLRFTGEKPVVKSSKRPSIADPHETGSPGKDMTVVIGDILWLTETQAEVSDRGTYYLTKINGQWQITGYETTLLE